MFGGNIGIDDDTISIYGMLWIDTKEPWPPKIVDFIWSEDIWKRA